MSMLMRAPRECASWFWDLEDYAQPGLHSALGTAGRMSAVPREYDLLRPSALEWYWVVPGKGAIAKTRLQLPKSFDDEQLAVKVAELRPVAFQQVEFSGFLVTGSGTWLDEGGAQRQEHGLVELTVSAEPLGLSADVAVHHDIWGPFDFRGAPHPEVHQRISRRLAAALKDLEGLLGVMAEPGEATCFGRAEGYGVVSAPDM
ncbi:hypothetical protein AB0C59_24685 [Streptomyces sp. NPDC048664]|uniref:hypothetical protein n=1 Tax=Streptomyces sp. NPDC048664 TaxID=3154505 RepID=UPI00343A3045